jgi:hypothetical protein
MTGPATRLPRRSSILELLRPVFQRMLSASHLASWIITEGLINSSFVIPAQAGIQKLPGYQGLDPGLRLVSHGMAA